jgi:hypothetical protein
MRATEFVTGNKEKRLFTQDFTIQISDHAIQRCWTRGIDPTEIDGIIHALPKIKEQIYQMEPGEKFTISNPRGIHIGAIRGQHPKKLYINTVYHQSYENGLYPNINVDSEKVPLPESFSKFSPNRI